MPIADMVLTADTSQVKTATQVVDKFRESLLKLAKNQQELEKTLKDYTRESRAEVSSMRERLAFSKRMEAQKAKEARQVEISAGKAERARLKQEKAAEAVAAAEERLRHKYIEGYTAADLYSKELNDLAVARQKEIISADQQAAEVAALNKHYQAGTGIFANYANQMGKSANRMGMAMQQTGYQVGDFLVQIQGGTNPMVAFGQQATQLVGIMYLLPQATLAATIPIAGFAVSVSTLAMGLGILIPLATAIGAYFMRTAEAASDSADSLETLTSSVSAYKSALDLLSGSQEELNDRFGAFSVYINRISSELSTRAINQINAAVSSLATSFGDLERRSGMLSIATHTNLVDALGVYGEDTSTWTGSVYRFAEALDRLNQSVGIENQIAAADNLLTVFDNLTANLDTLSAGQVAYRDKIVDTMAALVELGESGTIDVTEGMDKLNQYLDDAFGVIEATADILKEELETRREIASVVREEQAALNQRIAMLRVQIRYGEDSAAARAMEVEYELDAYAADLRRQGVSETLVKQLTDQARIAGELEAELDRISKIRFPHLGDDEAMNVLALQDAYRQYAESRLAGDQPTESTSRGGGGGAEGPDRIGALAQSLVSERELIDSWRDESLLALEEFNARELDLVGGHEAAKLAIEAEYSRRLQALRDSANQHEIDARSRTVDGLIGLLSQLGSRSKTAAKAAVLLNAAKAFSETIANTAAAQVRALAELGPVAGPPAAAAIGAYGKVQLGIIGASTALRLGSAGGGGGGGLGGGSGGIATPDGSGSGPQKILIEGLNPGDMLSGEMLKELFDKIYDENDNRGAVFMVST